jgi:putative endonuclease
VKLRLFDRGAAKPDHLLRGARGEDLAYGHLRKLGYTVVARNYRTRDGRGEVDLIGWDREQLVFVEVKTRGSAEFGSPDSAIDSHKRQNIIRAAADYLRRAGVEWSCVRFDTVSVIDGDPVEVEVNKDAFSRRSVTSGRGGR